MSLHSRMETEAKFVIPNASVFEKLRQVTRLGDFVLTPMGVQTVVDDYYDTPDKRLYRAGYACRIRNLRGKKYLGLKELTPPEGIVHRREEFEVEVEADSPDKWPDSEVKQMVQDITGGSPLNLLFTIRQNRHKYTATLNGRPIIEFSLDEVSMNESGLTDHYSLEAELLSGGSDQDLIRFTDALQAEFLLRPDNLSKYERGLAGVNAARYLAKKPGSMLKDEERHILTGLTQHENPHIARRAAIILMADADIPAADIASDLQLTVRTVRHWRRAFKEKGMAIFPEEVFTPPVLATKEKASPEPEQSSPSPTPDKKTAPKLPLPLRKKIGLKPTDTMAEAGRKVIGFHLARMLSHEEGTRLGEDIEALHDMRVAVRRMRAALGIFQSAYTGKTVKALRKGLKSITKALGPARDMDVFIEKLQAYRATLPEAEQAGLTPLLENWQAQRETARKAMVDFLDSGKYAQVKKTLLNFVKSKGEGDIPVQKDRPTPHQLRHLVPQLIYARYAEVYAYDVVLDSASLETLHDLRLALKAFRYTLEFFRELLGPEVKAVLAEIKHLQDHLGDLNDADVAIGILQQQLAEWENYQTGLPLAERQSPTALINFLTHKTEERHRLIVSFPEAWARFNTPEFRQNLALAVAAI